jgi:hypothetical protein
MLVKVDDLRKGDVILVGINGSRLAEFKLLRQPMLATTGKKTTWWGLPRWKSVLCAVREEKITRKYTNHQGQSSNYDYTRCVIAEGQPYNREKRLDLTDKDIWLLKREEL